MRNANENSAISADAGAARRLSQAPFHRFRPAVCSLSFVSALLGTAGMAMAQETPPPAMPPADMMMMPAPMTPISTPAIAGPLSYPLMPFSLNLGPLGEKIYVDGAISGLAFTQSPATGSGSDSKSRADLDNGQIFIQKTDGVFQFFVQAGIYSLPTLGAPYFNSHQTEALTYGFVPQGFIKIAPADNFSVEIGKLPTLIGDEYTFTFENMNIFRGLLWGQELAVSRGVQANYTAGPLAFSLSLNDGYYSNRYNWVTGSAAWTIDMENSVSLVGGGNFGHTNYVTFATPIQNTGSIFNLIYTHSAGPWVFSPYLQYNEVGANPKLGISRGASTTGVAGLASYAFNDFIKLAGRIEYISSTGKGPTLASSTNLLFGPSSNAFSFTITPTFQYEIFFARVEYSYVTASSTTAGFGFGPTGVGTSQSRFAVEAGILF